MDDILTATFGERSCGVTKFTREGIYFSELVKPEGDHVAFKFCANVDGIALELPVSGEVTTTPSGCVIPVQFTPAQSAALRALFGINEGSEPHDLVEILNKSKIVEPQVTKSVSVLTVRMAAALGFAMLATILYLQASKQNNILAQAAFVATNATVLESNSSGIVEYLAENGPIKKGEVYAAIRTKSGRSVFLEASAAGTLQNAGAQAGRSIVKGNPLVYVSNASDKLFVKAYVTTASAVKLPHGYSIEIEANGGTGKGFASLEAIAATDITRDFQYTDQIGNPLSEIVLPLSVGSTLVPGQAVTVRFTHHSIDMFRVPFAQLGKLWQGWLGGKGDQV